MASTLKEWHGKSVFVLTGDGRIIIGNFIGHDQVQNLILNDAQERVYAPDEDVEEIQLGLYLIRGDNICLIGEYDPARLSETQRVPFVIPHVEQKQF